MNITCRCLAAMIFHWGEDILEYSYYYPIFPRDYEIVRNAIIYDFGTKQVTLPDPDIEEYRGRNIIFSATPGAKSGRIGVQMASHPVFISGLPVTDSLVLHLDANQTRSYRRYVGSFSRFFICYRMVGCFQRHWQICYEKAFSSGSTHPSLLKTEMGVEFIGQHIRFTGRRKLTIK